MKLTNWLDERSDNIKYNNDIIARLNRYILPFFGKMEITVWNRNENQRTWLDWLVEKGLSVSTIQVTRNAANLFLKHKCEISDGELEYSKIRLSLPSLTTKKKYKVEVERKLAMRKEDVTRIEGQYICDEDFETIIQNSHGYLKSLIWVSYHYGLRLSECLAAVEGDYRNDFLLVSRQAATQHTNKYLKGVLDRKAPHFELTMEKKLQTKEYITSIAANRVNPTSVSRDFKKLMKLLNMNYRFHDLRGTWITNLSLSSVPAELIRQAAGHRDMKTTNRYLRDPHVSEEGNKVFGE